MSHLDNHRRPNRFASKSARALRAGTWLPLLIALGGCAQILGLDDDSHRATGSSSTPTSSGSGASGACADCTTVNDCLPASCHEGACAFLAKVAREPCQNGVCDGAGTCVECTVNEDCASDRFCDASHRCAPKKTPGTHCSSTNECAMGHCAGSGSQKVCCSSDCQSNCESCLETDTHQPDGICAAILLGSDPKGGCAGITCGSDKCDGSGACGLAMLGTACSTPTCAAAFIDPADTCDANGQCIVSSALPCAGSFVCDPMTNACPTECVAQTDCVAGTYCAAPLCLPTKPKSATCVDDFECTSGNCGSAGKCK